MAGTGCRNDPCAAAAVPAWDGLIELRASLSIEIGNVESRPRLILATAQADILPRMTGMAGPSR